MSGELQKIETYMYNVIHRIMCIGSTDVQAIPIADWLDDSYVIPTVIMLKKVKTETINKKIISY